MFVCTVCLTLACARMKSPATVTVLPAAGGAISAARLPMGNSASDTAVLCFLFS